MALNARQLQFVEEYLVDLNATQAAVRAGYSAKTARAIGARLLTHVDIAAAITARQADRAERVQVSQDYVLTNTRDVVERCMQRAPVMVREGRKVVQAIDEEGRHVWQFDARGAMAGLTLLAKHLGMLVDRHEHSGPDGAAIPHSVTVRFIRPGA